MRGPRDASPRAGEVSGERIDELRDLGYSDEQIAEVIGLVALQFLTGAFNLVADIEPSATATGAACARRRCSPESSSR